MNADSTEPTPTPTGPLAHLRIVDLSAVVSGLMAAGLLADQGAQVVKVETRQGNLTRHIGPAKDDISALFAAINRGKRSIVLDLKQADGRRVLCELLASADVLIESFRPGAMARLGLAYEDVAAFNPRIICLSISGFGQTGRQSQVRVYDSVIQAAAGFADAHPDPHNGEPQLLQTLVCDKLTALTAAQAVTAALLGRERSGQGQKIALAMLDAAVAFLWPEAMYNQAFQHQPPPAMAEFGASQRLWRCVDGWLAISTPQNDEFAALCRVLGQTDLITDPRFTTIPGRRQHLPQLRERLAPLVAQRLADDMVAELGAAGVPAGRVNSKAGLSDDAQVQHNALLGQTD